MSNDVPFQNLTGYALTPQGMFSAYTAVRAAQRTGQTQRCTLRGSNTGSPAGATNFVAFATRAGVLTLDEPRC